MIMKTLHTIYTSFAKRLLVLIAFGFFTIIALGANTVSWTATTGSLGSAISSKGGTATGTIQTGSFSWNYTRTLVSLTSGKSDHIAMNNGYMQVGSSNAGETLRFTTSNIPGTIKSVAVDCWSKDGNHTLAISVGGNSYYSGATPSASGTTKTGTGTSSGTIDIYFSISKNNALYVKSITVIYEEAPSTFTVTCQSNNANYGSVSPSSVKNVANNTSISANGNQLTIGTTTVTATPNAQDADYTYAFKEWSGIPDGGKVTKNITITANFTRTERALTNYRTTCTEPCEQLGAATGLTVETDFVQDGQTYVKFSWTPADNTKSHATKQVICIGKVGEEKKCTDLEENYNWTADLRSKLSPGEYEWTIQAIGNGETYCDGEVIRGPNFTIEEPLTDNCRWVEIALEDITPEDEIVVTMGNDEIGYALGTEKITNSPKSQEIAIQNGVISENQDFDYASYSWNISSENGGYILRPNGKKDTYLRGLTSYITIGSDATNNVFYIFTNTENNNKCFFYIIGENIYYLGHGTENEQKAWKQLTSYASLLKSNTLKFYKKTCLPADEYWVNYNLSNVTCTTGEKPNNISDEDLMLEFSANEGYKLPESISVSVGNNILPEDNDVYIWDSENGELLIFAAQVTDNITITIEGCERLATPTNLSVTNITSTSARLSWNAVTNADEYRICVMDGETQLDELTTTETYVNVMNLKKNSFYTWDVVAEANDYCESLATAWIEFTTLDVYTVTFNTDGGTDVAPQAVDAGSKITAPANPSAAGYTFNYWYTTDANVPFDFDTPITGNTTLNAKWTPNVYTITFYKQSGTSGTDNATVTFNSNNYSVSTIEAPTRDKYAFGGYYTEQHGAGIQVVNADGNWLKNVAGYTDANGNWIKAENTHLYAKWTAIYTITWVVNNNTETPYHTSTVLSGSTIDQLPTPPADDLFEDCEVNAFVGWSTDNIGLEPDATAPTDLFKTIAETQSKIGAINGDKKFYAVYASEVEQIATFEADGLNGLSANSTLKWTHDNSGISLAISAGQRYTGSPKTFTITNGTSNYCEIVAPEGKSLKKAVVSITGSNYKVNSVSSPWSLSTTSSTIQTITTSTNATDLKMYATSSYQIRITQVDVTYTTYSNYITRCTALPDPVWGGATIDKTEIAVNCGETSSTNGAAKISFLKETNFNLYKDITVEVTSGNFIIASSRDGEYTTFVTLSPTQNGENVGTFANKYVYVRAVAPPMSSNQLTGTITISGKQITTQVINVTATVTCNEYTLTFNDCGDTKTITDFAGTSVEEMEPWAETCSEPFQYVFDGWATKPVTNGAEEYEKVDFSTFTMPNNDTTILYAVYRYAEEGGEPVNGYVKVTEALTDWSGDYVIVDDENLFAIKNAYRENTSSNKTLAGETVTIENDKVVSPSANIVWTFSKNGDGYTMYSDANKMYAGVTSSDTRKAILSSEVTDDCIFKFIFDNTTYIAKVSAITTGRCFQYYVNGDQKEWRTYSSSLSQYNTGYLYRLSNKTIRYTSSFVCGSIEAENAIVTSTVGQIVKVNVPITLKYSGAASITGTSDNEAFTVVTKNDVAVGESNIEVHYKPTAYVNTANQEETATITLATSNGATTTFNVTGRCLPEAFVIAAKWGNNWYALPANMSSETTAEGLLIEVDNPTNPAKAIAAPNTTKYSLKAVYKSNQSADRFAECGNRLVFVEEVEEATPVANKTLYNGGGDAQNSSRTNIQVYAQYSGYYNSNPDRYEWIPTTTDLKDYTLISAHVFTDEAARTISLDNHGVFGTLLQNKSYNGMVRLLPVDEFYTPTELQVVEWKANSVSIMYTGKGTKATTQVGNSESAVQLLSEKKIDHAVYTLSTSDLIAATNQVLTISIQDNDGNIIGIHKMTVPWILNSSKSSDEIASEVTQATDIVVLNGATLTAANTKHTYDDVVVYPGGKLVIGVDGKLGMYSLTLRLGSSWGAAEYEHKYPEFVLNTNTNQAYSNTSGKINLDYVTTKSQYYTFVAPFEVKTKDIKYPVDIYGSNVEAANRGSFEFQYYDGAARAAGEKGWKVVEEDPTDGATLTAHKGYTFYGMPKKVSVNGGTSTRQKFGIHRIPMSIGAAKVMEHENTAQTSAVSAYPSEHNIHAGWNLIGNPYMSTISGLDNRSIQTGTIVLVDNRWQWSDQGTQANRFIVFPSNDGEWYYTSQATNAELPAFKNFFVQIGDKNATDLSIPRNTSQAQLLAPIRHTDEEVEHDIEMAIVLEKDEANSDQMDFLINDAYGAGFDYNADFTKMMNNTQLNLYGVLMEDNLSFVALDHYSARGSVAIGYQVPSAGEYTLRISDKPYVMLDRIEALYVTDHEMNPAVTTNLMEEDYVFHVGKAEINDTRFTISLTVETNTNGDDITTDMGELDIHSKQPQKFFYDSKLYILRDGKIYSATGHEIKTINE